MEQDKNLEDTLVYHVQRPKRASKEGKARWFCSIAGWSWRLDIYQDSEDYGTVL